MKFASFLATAALSAAAAIKSRDNTYAGYLITTFSDANPAVQFHLSNGNDPKSYSFSNGGQAVLTSTVGTKGVRDVYLTSTPDRSKWYILATDLDIRIPNFTFDQASRTGSKGLVIWESNNLVDWSESRLVTVESDEAGMAWAPSAVWDESSSRFNVFWSSRLYASDDTEHTGTSTLNKIRWASTSDFINFTPPQDYWALADTSLIDQEFQYLGTPGHYARFLKNETISDIYQEVTTDGIFGTWTRAGTYISTDRVYEGPAAFMDNQDPSKYYVLCDNYQQYDMFETSDILSGQWTRSQVGSGFPSGLKHGSVTPLTAGESEAFAARYPA